MYNKICMKTFAQYYNKDSSEHGAVGFDFRGLQVGGDWC